MPRIRLGQSKLVTNLLLQIHSRAGSLLENESSEFSIERSHLLLLLKLLKGRNFVREIIVEAVSMSLASDGTCPPFLRLLLMIK